MTTFRHRGLFVDWSKARVKLQVNRINSDRLMWSEDNPSVNEGLFVDEVRLNVTIWRRKSATNCLTWKLSLTSVLQDKKKQLGVNFCSPKYFCGLTGIMWLCLLLMNRILSNFPTNLQQFYNLLYYMNWQKTIYFHYSFKCDKCLDWEVGSVGAVFVNSWKTLWAVNNGLSFIFSCKSIPHRYLKMKCYA